MSTASTATASTAEAAATPTGALKISLELFNFKLSELF